MNESAMYGTKNVSYQNLMDTRLIIKHNQAVMDDAAPGARTRHISALFVENQDGERFKYPFIHLAGARAMQRHVANGGVPYDDIGKSIVQMSEEIAQLKSFGSYVVRNDLMNSDTNSVVERSTNYLNSLREQIKALAKQGHYEAYKENFQSQQNFEVPQDVVEDFKDKFTVRSFKEDIATVFPVLYRLMQEENKLGYDDIVAMTQEELQTEDLELDRDQEEKDPFDQFESWVMALGEEGAIQSVDAEEQAAGIRSLQELMSQNFPAGVDGVNAIESLKGIIEDPSLFRNIKDASTTDPDTDIRPLVKEWLDMNVPDVVSQIDFGDLGVEDPMAYANDSADADAIAYGQQEAYGDSGWDDPAWEPRKPERNVDWDIEAERNAPEKAPSKSTVTIRDAEGNVVLKFPSTGEYWGDVKHSASKGFDTDSGEYDISWGRENAESSEEDKESSKKLNSQELAEFIHSFYDKESGTFPKGPEGVCTMVGKKFGEQAENVARKFVERMAPQQSTEQNPELAELARVRELAGL